MGDGEPSESIDRPSPAGMAALGGRIAWTLALVFGAVVVTWAISQHPAFVAFEMNADTLLAPAFVEDVLHHPYAWTGFQLARIPSLAPDLLLQLLARLVSPTPAWGVFVYCAAQFAGLVFAAGWLTRLLARTSYLWAMTCAFLLLSLAVLAETLPPGPSGLPLMWFQSCAHAGPFILCLCACALAAKLMEAWSPWRAGLLFATGTAAVVSDRLVLVELVAPVAVAALAVSFATRRVSRSALGIVAILVAATAVALLLDRLIYREPDVPIGFGGMAGRIGLFLRETPGFFAGHFGSILVGGVIPGLVFLAYPRLAALRSTQAAFTPLGEAAPEPAPFADDPRRWFLWLTAGLAIAGIGVSTIALVFDGPATYRYFSPVAVWPLLFCAALLARAPRRGLAAGVLGAAGAALLLGTAATAKDARPGPVAWRSDVAQCLSANQARYGLRQGFADYWTARPVSFTTDGALQVEEMGANGGPLVYGADLFGLLKQHRAPQAPAVFNYIVLRGLDEGMVRRRYGAPATTFQCGADHADVWVYADGPALTRNALTDFTPPPGPYRGDCANALLLYGDLVAECRSARGPRYSRLRAIAQCDGAVTAPDGVLKAHCVRHFRRLSRLLHPPKPKP